MKTWLSPAKLNLFLHITGRRDDGYHELQTAFQFLNHCDELQFKITQELDVELLTPVSGIDNDDNLIVCAAELLQQMMGVGQGVKISLVKYLPIGGGLGGGSSNAATTLVALNQLWQCKISYSELSEIGLMLGADVPIFIHGRAAWAEGVGEELTFISLPEPWYVVIVPDCQVSTAEIFSAIELTRDCEPITMSSFLSGKSRNVCESVVIDRYKAVSEALVWLAQFGQSRMTGTGACVFTDFDNQQEAQMVVDSLPENWHGFVAKACNKSPLATIN